MRQNLVDESIDKSQWKRAANGGLGWRREASLGDGGELVAGRQRGGEVIEKVKL